MPIFAELIFVELVTTLSMFSDTDIPWFPNTKFVLLVIDGAFTLKLPHKSIDWHSF
jgi:hypothetical protein